MDMAGDASYSWKQDYDNFDLVEFEKNGIGTTTVGMPQGIIVMRHRPTHVYVCHQLVCIMRLDHTMSTTVQSVCWAEASPGR
jgi:hypothetical protein